MPTIFFFNDTATTEIYTLSLHDALPISGHTEATYEEIIRAAEVGLSQGTHLYNAMRPLAHRRSEEHTSELQSRQYLVCRLLLEKKKVTGRLLCTLHALPAGRHATAPTSP